MRPKPRVIGTIAGQPVLGHSDYDAIAALVRAPDDPLGQLIKLAQKWIEEE